MTETLDSTAPAAEAGQPAAKKRGGGLNSMLLADLKAMAGGMGIAGAGSMKKAQLVDAIKSAQAGSKGETPRAEAPPTRDRSSQRSADATDDSPATEQAGPRQDKQPQDEQPQDEQTQDDQGKQRQGRQARQDKQNKQDRQEPASQGRSDQSDNKSDEPDKADQPDNKPDNKPDKQGKDNKPDDRQKQPGQQGRGAPHKQGNQQGGQQNSQQGGGAPDKADQRQDQPDDDDSEGGSRRNRRRRGRDRDRAARPGREPDTEVREDDVLVPAAGILDVLDNYAFVRTSGYLAGVDDVYLSLSLVRKYGLRRGDAITGQVRQPREGERREKFNPMVRIDTVNGVDPEQAKSRVEFEKLTPVYPDERLRMETGPDNLTGRLIDLAAPIGKGQRGMIISPAKAGKTMLLKSIAGSITANSPEAHLMVVLVDERPEEVTDFERSIKGEVIASTFDRPPSDHTTVAELAIERAKRLVELGHDVVVLLDGLTRLGRAYNLANPASGRILSGGVDSAALYPPKRFFGAARNIENGGSLTIVATAQVESGSKMDEVIFEEFGGTANMELRLRSEFASKLLFPAVDVVASGTRREDVLVGEGEHAVLDKLRRTLGRKESVEEHADLVADLRKTSTNYEFLLQVQKS